MHTTMKKIYIIPEMQLTQLACESLIAESVVVDGQKTATGTSGGWVKEDAASRQDYNVWDDDWSKN